MDFWKTRNSAAALRQKLQDFCLARINPQLELRLGTFGRWWWVLMSSEGHVFSFSSNPWHYILSSIGSGKSRPKTPLRLQSSVHLLGTRATNKAVLTCRLSDKQEPNKTKGEPRNTWRSRLAKMPHILSYANLLHYLGGIICNMIEDALPVQRLRVMLVILVMECKHRNITSRSNGCPLHYLIKTPFLFVELPQVNHENASYSPYWLNIFEPCWISKNHPKNVVEKCCHHSPFPTPTSKLTIELQGISPVIRMYRMTPTCGDAINL